MAKQKEKLVTLTLKVPPEVTKRIAAFTSEGDAIKDSELNKSQVARRALLIGLGMIESDHSLLLGSKSEK